MACGCVKNQCNKCGKDFLADYESVCPVCKKADCGSPQLYEGWRDASKELPDVIDRYLVYVKHDMYREIKVYSFHPGDYDNSGWIHNARIVDNVIAWRPLPDPPAFV